MSKLILPPSMRKDHSVNVNVTTLNDKVVVQFDRPIQEVVLSSGEAAQLAQGLACAAQALVKQQPIDYSLPPSNKVN